MEEEIVLTTSGGRTVQRGRVVKGETGIQGGRDGGVSLSHVSTPEGTNVELGCSSRNEHKRGNKRGRGLGIFKSRKMIQKGSGVLITKEKRKVIEMNEERVQYCLDIKTLGKSTVGKLYRQRPQEMNREDSREG